jgi:Tol biopolymer transport system component
MRLLRARRALLLAVVLLWFGTPEAPVLAQKLDNTSIVFLSNRDHNQRGFDLFLRSVDHEKPLNLTINVRDAGITSASSPRLLVKRNSVVFFSSLTKTFKEFDLATSKIRPIIGAVYEAPQFDISPDQRFLLLTERIDTTLQLVEVNLATGAQSNLTNNRFNNIEPRYAPDGNKIVFVCDADGSHSIAVMNRDGSNQRVLTNNFGDDRYPSFSPDSKRIVFVSSRSATVEDEYDVYTIDADGKNFSIAYDGRTYASRPEFSRDGTSIVFVASNRAKKLSHILVKNLTSGVVTNITKDLALLSQHVSISPDRRFLVFEHMTVSDCEIMSYEFATGTLRNLSNSTSWDCSPSY